MQIEDGCTMILTERGLVVIPPKPRPKREGWGG